MFSDFPNRLTIPRLFQVFQTSVTHHNGRGHLETTKAGFYLTEQIPLLSQNQQCQRTVAMTEEQ